MGKPGPHSRRQSEAVGEQLSRFTVGDNAFTRASLSRAQHVGHRSDPARRILAGTDLGHHRRHEFPVRRSQDGCDGGSQRDVIAARHLCRFVRVGGAAEKAQQRHVVDVRASFGSYAEPFGDPHRQDTGANGLLERLAHSQVGG